MMEAMIIAANMESEPIYREEIITVYPTKGENNFQGIIAGTIRNYTDPITSQNWEITEDSKDYLGFKCRKATSHFRGRDYEAWYTEDIPMPYGPYNFRGLPGLIVELTDSKHEYGFFMIGVENTDKDNIIPILLLNGKSVEQITRNDYRQLVEYYNFHGAERLLDNKAYAPVTEEEREQMIKELNHPRPYNPIELE